MYLVLKKVVYPFYHVSAAYISPMSGRCWSLFWLVRFSEHIAIFPLLFGDFSPTLDFSFTIL